MTDDLDFPRLGFLYGDYEPTSRVPALLSVTADRGVRIEVPFAGGHDVGEEYADWFTGDIPCPSELAFRDHRLDIHLLGVRPTGHTGHGSFGPGVGYLHAAFAVEDRDYSEVSYAEVDQMRSSTELLHDFMGWKLSTMDHQTPDGTLREVQFRTARAAPFKVGEFDGMNVFLDPHWWAGQRDHRRSEILESTHVRTIADPPRPLAEHATVHERLRDLIAFVCWKTVDVESVEVQRIDAPARVLSGDAVGPAWRTMHTASLQRHRKEGTRKFSFSNTLPPASFETLGVAGVAAWLAMGESLRRVTDPLINLLYMSSATPEIALMQAGIAIEALGYHLALARGVTRREAKGESFVDRLTHVADHSPLPLDDVIQDRVSWIERTASAYNGIKHANRGLPDPQVCYLFAQTLTMLIRAHVLMELGVSADDARAYRKQAQWWTLKEAYRRHVRFVP